MGEVRVDLGLVVIIEEKGRWVYTPSEVRGNSSAGQDGEPQRKLMFTKFRLDYALGKRVYKQVIPRKLHI